MAFTDFHTNFHLFIRWLHVIAGITWIGLLYFFNFINSVLQSKIDDATKKAINPQLMPRTLWWFRWGAMITFLAGLILFTINYMHTPGQGFGPTVLFTDAEGMTGRAIWILMGMLFGTIMWFNVWFIIWPAQKKLLSGQATPEETPVLRKRAGLASKINTYFSGPMLFGMLAAPHYGAINLVTLLVFAAISLGGIWVAFAHASKVGESV